MGSHCRTLRASATNADGQGDNTAAFGPEPPPEIPENAPEWVKDLYRDADYDEELREVRWVAE